jgi:hypothetical protein
VPQESRLTVALTRFSGNSGALAAVASGAGVSHGLEETVTRDDLNSLAAISFGTLVAIAASAFLTAPDAVLPTHAAVALPATLILTSESSGVIDFAIIREPVDVMAGPEGPHSGWSPPGGLGSEASPRR